MRTARPQHDTSVRALAFRQRFRIVVTGATGHIGRELVRLLSARGIPVRAVARNPDPRAALPAVEWVAADLADRHAIAGVCAGADRLFLLTANSEDMVRLQKNAITAAAAAGVRHVVKLSALGATDRSKSVVGLWHFNVERVLRDSGLSWTMLRPHHFMQNLLDPMVYDREMGRVYAASGDGRIPFIDARDIATAVVTDTVEWLIGRAPRMLREFIEDHADMLQPRR